jgi:hypothetical protein
MRGKKGEKLLSELPAELNELGPRALNELGPRELNELGPRALNELGPNNVDVAFINVDLYGGTSHVKEGLEHDGKPAGSTAAWLESKLLASIIPGKNTHLIALWDRCIEGNKKYELSITRRTVELMKDKKYTVKVLQKEYNEKELDKCKSSKASYKEINNARFKELTGGRRKSKKRTRRTNGARKSRKLRR